MKRKNSRRRSYVSPICILTVTAILFTYVVTVFLSGKETAFAKREAAALRNTFAAQLGNNVLTLTEEEYILGHMAAALPPEAEEEAMKAMAVVLRTQLRRMQEEGQSAFGTTFALKAAATESTASALTATAEKSAVSALKATAEGSPASALTATAEGSTASALTATAKESTAPPSSVADAGIQISPSAFMEEYMCARLWGMERYMLFQKKAKTAIQATDGQVLCDENGAYIEAAYHGISAGTTRDGGEAYPYLRGRDSRSDLSSPHYLTIYWFETERLLQLFPDVSEEQWAQIMPVEETDSFYIKEVALGGQLISGEEFRSRLSLCSSAYAILWQGGGLQVICRGQGHGFGLSCHGAEARAAAGEDYASILSYYYENIVVKNE